jgi:hypothetical protein
MPMEPGLPQKLRPNCVLGTLWVLIDPWHWGSPSCTSRKAGILSSVWLYTSSFTLYMLHLGIIAPGWPLGANAARCVLCMAHIHRKVGQALSAQPKNKQSS